MQLNVFHVNFRSLFPFLPLGLLSLLSHNDKHDNKHHGEQAARVSRCSTYSCTFDLPYTNDDGYTGLGKVANGLWILSSFGGRDESEGHGCGYRKCGRQK